MMSDSIGVFEAIHTLRSIRRLKPDPVPEEHIERILEAATKAPSGGNRQPWNFIVIRDPATKRRIGDLYLEGAVAAGYGSRPGAPPQRQRTHFGDVPVLILVCLRPQAATANTASSLYGSIYPAIQNILLAARALGLGTTLTTLHQLREKEIKELLGVPEEVETVALIPVGYPKGRFGPTQRLPWREVTYFDKWGAKP